MKKNTVIMVALLAAISRSMPRGNVKYWFSDRCALSVSDEKTLYVKATINPEDVFWEKVEASYAAMRANQEYWESEMEERRLWGIAYEKGRPVVSIYND